MLCNTLILHSITDTPTQKSFKFDLGHQSDQEGEEHRKKSFQKVFNDGSWIGSGNKNIDPKDSVAGRSGGGSLLKNTKNIRKILSILISTLKVCVKRLIFIHRAG